MSKNYQLLPEDRNVPALRDHDYPMPELDESGIDLAFDVLMSLEENNDLSAALKGEDIATLWNLQAEQREPGGADKNIPKETMEILECDRFYQLQSKRIEGDSR